MYLTNILQFTKSIMKKIETNNCTKCHIKNVDNI